MHRRQVVGEMYLLFVIFTLSSSSCFLEVSSDIGPPSPRPVPYAGNEIDRKIDLKESNPDKVSWKECNIDDSLKKSCGYHKIGEQGYNDRECCWNADKVDGIPRCYHSKPNIVRRCTMKQRDREECGFDGIRKEQCMHVGCCWQPSNTQGIPWCYNMTYLEIQTGECGDPAIKPAVSRIVGGQAAIPHSWPWQVSLQSTGHFCGGSIINNEWIVSAGHCEYSRMKSIVVGMHNRSNAGESQRAIGIKKMIAHEDGFESDIMLIKLAEPIEFSDEVSPVCLPKQDEEFEAGGKCYTTGWGRLMSGGKSPDELQQVKAPLIERDICNQEDWYDGSVGENMICAGYEEGGRDSCQGDSGGPLVCYVKNRWKLVGVVSWGYGCAFERKPGVYAKTSSFINWIREKINEYD